MELVNKDNLQEMQPTSFYWRKNTCSDKHIGNMVHKNKMLFFFLLLKKPGEISFDRDVYEKCVIKEFQWVRTILTWFQHHGQQLSTSHSIQNTNNALPPGAVSNWQWVEKVDSWKQLTKGLVILHQNCRGKALRFRSLQNIRKIIAIHQKGCVVNSKVWLYESAHFIVVHSNKTDCMLTQG